MNSLKQEIKMIINSKQIRNLIKVNFDIGKSIFTQKLYRTKAIKDKSFYASVDVFELRSDFEAVKLNISRDFGVSVEAVKHLATNPDTIWDCDNMARELRRGLHRLHYGRFRAGEHRIPYEYAAFQITEEVHSPFLNNGRGWHDFVMVFTGDGICFADLMRDKVWHIDQEKPIIIDIGG